MNVDEIMNIDNTVNRGDICIVCGEHIDVENDIKNRITCSQKCHEEFIKFAERKFGTIKKVVCVETGKTYQVPTRDIIEKGLTWRDLPKYPVSDDEKLEKYISGKSEKYIVDNIFSKVGSVLVIPVDEDSQNILNQFDHPEKLIVSYGPYGYTIQHKDHISYLEKRVNVVSEFLKEKNITAEDVKNLSFCDILSMREEIDKRMEK